MVKISRFCYHFKSKNYEIFQLIKKVNEKVPGYHFGLAGGLTLSTSIGIAFYLYLSVDPSYSIFTHWISHLGVGPNYACHFFNIGFPLSYMMLSFFHFREILEFEKKGLNVLFLDIISLSSLFQLGGAFLAGFFPLNNELWHSFAANIYFISGLLFYISYSFSIIVISEKVSIKAISGIITAAAFFSFLLIQAITTLDDALPFGKLNYFIEWLTMFSSLAFIFINNIYSMKESKIKSFFILIDKYISLTSDGYNRFY